MSYLLVPHEVTDTSARIWLAGIGESLAGSELFVSETGQTVSLEASPESLWRSRAGRRTMDRRYVLLKGLEPRRTYSLELRRGTAIAQGNVSTLPSELPKPDAPPFRVMVSSCFSAARDSGALGNTFALMPRSPDIKFLCGDQVYLDTPTKHFLLHDHDRDDLEEKLFDSYVASWSQEMNEAGFKRLLSHGANYFCSDDHEFWNNAPNRTPLVRDSWTSQGRQNWMGIATDLLRLFQADYSSHIFSVGTLSFCIVDTRIHRDAGETTFMHPNDLARLRVWVAGLQGPGVLVLGQPVLTGKRGWLGRVSDWGLADYRQYEELVRLLAESKHTLVVATGDVHFGRVASATLRPGVELIEVISSPTALINDLVGRKWHAPPDWYPAFDITNITKNRIQAEQFRPVEDQFQTLDFRAVQDRVLLTVHLWKVASGTTPSPTRMFNRIIG